jgi:hypothetical protein
VANFWLATLVEADRRAARCEWRFSRADASPPPVAAAAAGPHEGATRNTEPAMRAIAEKKSIGELRPRKKESKVTRLVFMGPELRAIISHYSILINHGRVWRGRRAARDHGSAVNR